MPQDGPGKYNDDVWEALDRVLDEARKAGLKVMLSFLDNWKYIGTYRFPQHSTASAHVLSAGLSVDLRNFTTRAGEVSYLY